MSRRNKPKNKTIVKEALKVIKIEQAYYDHERVLANFDGDTFMFPNDLDTIYPIQKDGNLCIQFPE